MDLQLNNRLFIVGGATSGFGLAVANALLAEGASIIAIARGEANLTALADTHVNRVEICQADITADGAVQQLEKQVGYRQVHGILVNAGGPPAKTVAETTLDDWDAAYRTILRWKVDLCKTFVPKMTQAGYGRIVFIESSSVKQYLENMVLSAALRLAVAGFAKSYAAEVAAHGVTMNVLAPGSHNTPAIERVYKKKSEQTGLPIEKVRQESTKQIPVGVLGDPADFASLAVWLLSPHSRFITGQTLSVDGGTVKSIFG